DLRRLPHDVTELAGHLQTGFTVHPRRLDEQDVPARAGHGQTGRHAGYRSALGGFEEELLPAEVPRNVLGADAHRRLMAARCDIRGRLAQYPTKLALQAAHAGFTGVLGDDAPQSFVVDGHLPVAEPLFRQLTGQQVIARDSDLLL